MKNDFQLLKSTLIPIMLIFLVVNFLFVSGSFFVNAIEISETFGDTDNIIANVNQEKGEKIIIILPDGKNYQSLTGLEDTLQSKYQIKSENIIKVNSSETACNDWKRLEENTLILIGDRSNNNAIRCTPWFDVGKKPSDTFTASVTLERNVWGGNNYAIVLSGNTTQATLYLKDLIENPERHELAENTQTIYLNEFSMPPEYTTGKDYINGYALGQCENINEGDGQLGCHILSFGTYFVPYVGWAAVGRDVGNYCLVAEHDGTDWFGCAASATAIGVKLGLVGKTFNWLKPTTELKAYTKLQTIIRSHTPQHADNILNTLNINNKQKIKNFFQTNKQETALENELASKLDELERTLKANKNGAKQISQFDKSTLQNTIKNSDDFNNLIKGAELANSYTPDIKKIPLPEQELANTLKKLGTITEVPGVKSTGSGANKIQGLAEMFAKQNDASSIKGHVFHIDVTSSLNQNKNVKHLEVEKKIFLEDRTEITSDVFYEIADSSKRIMGEVKSSTNLFLEEDLKKQLIRYSKAVDEEQVQEAYLIIKGTTNVDVKQFIIDNNLKVKIIENWKGILE